MTRAHDFIRSSKRPGRSASAPALVRVLASFGLVLLLAGCGDRRSIGPSGQAGELPDQVVEDFAFTGTNSGVVEWKLYAQRAEIFEVRNTTIVRGLRVDFFDEAGKQSSRLTAREGEMNDISGDMLARGNVVMQNSDGARMSTQSMRFLNRQQKIVSDELVRVERGGDVLSGIGFESDPDLKHYQFRKRIVGTVRSKSEALMGGERTGP